MRSCRGADINMYVQKTTVIAWQLLTSGYKVLVVDTRVVNVMHDTCKYRSKYLQIREHVLHTDGHYSVYM